MFIKISLNLRERTCAKVSSFLNVLGFRLKLFKKRDSCTCVFLWIMQNFYELLFCTTPLMAPSEVIMQTVFECFDLGKKATYEQKSLELKDLKVKCKQRGSKKDIKYIENHGTRRSTYSTRGTSAVILVSLKSVCNFQTMKSPVKLNSLLSKFFCYITVVWWDATLETLEMILLCQIPLFRETIAYRFKNYKLK